MVHEDTKIYFVGLRVPQATNKELTGFRSNGRGYGDTDKSPNSPLSENNILRMPKIVIGTLKIILETQKEPCFTISSNV